MRISLLNSLMYTASCCQFHLHKTMNGCIGVLHSTEVGGAYTRANAVPWTSCLKDRNDSTGSCEMMGCVHWNAQLDRWKTALTDTIVSAVSESAQNVS